MPACLYVFDLVGLGGQDLRTLTYLERREHLERLGLPHGPILLPSLSLSEEVGQRIYRCW
ncbi:hypothetical protein [Nocardia sp. NPDC051981]|uniref:hypothetical protein n=1 Tax=Nocardia sp. NPDC051981 TaxID=3155417 RepID=UPI00341A56B6